MLRLLSSKRPEFSGGDALAFDASGAAKGDLLVALVVRNAAVTPPAGWTAIESGLGGSSLFLDAFARMVDDGEPSSAVFAGGTEELQGALLVLRGGSIALLKESSATGTFTADATPNTPAAASLQAINLIVGVWSAGALVDLETPSGYTLIDVYSSSDVAPRSILVAYKIANATGAAIAQPAAASSPASTGRTFVLVLRNGLPFEPQSLIDPVSGNVGLLGKDERAPREIPFGA
jgi:hypothetical protein